MSGAAKPFLTPGLAATAADLRPSLRGSRAGPGCGELGCDHLMEDVEIGLDSKDFDIEFHVAAGLPVSFEEWGLDVSHAPSPPL